MTNVKSLLAMYVKMGGSLTDTYSDIAGGVPVGQYSTISDAILACSKKYSSGGGGGGAFLAEITTQDMEHFTLVTPPSEVFAAAEEGPVASIIVKEVGGISYVLFLNLTSVGSGDDHGTTRYQLVFNSSGSSNDYHDFNLIFNGAVDGGTNTATMQREEGLPDYESSDYGKVLSANYNGLGWVDKPIAKVELSTSDFSTFTLVTAPSDVYQAAQSNAVVGIVTVDGEPVVESFFLGDAIEDGNDYIFTFYSVTTPGSTPKLTSLRFDATTTATAVEYTPLPNPNGANIGDGLINGSDGLEWQGPMIVEVTEDQSVAGLYNSTVEAYDIYTAITERRRVLVVASGLFAIEIIGAFHDASNYSFSLVFQNGVVYAGPMGANDPFSFSKP